MKIIITIILFCASITVFAQSKQDTTLNVRLNKLEFQLKNIEKYAIEKYNLENEITSVNDKLDFQQKMIEQSNSNISNQLDSASYNLTLFGLLFAIAAIGLGLYVTFIERKIVKIGEENKELFIKNQKIKEDVEALNKLIQSDIYNLFLKIKSEETDHIIERLIKVPKDISNVLEILLSREINEENFAKVKLAYSNLRENGKIFQNKYHYLFFQHFFGQSLKDETIRKDILNFIPTGIKQSFENDILKSMQEFVTVIVDKGIQEFKAEINMLFKGLTNSEHKKYDEVYKLIFDNLKTRNNRFELFNAIESNLENRHSKIEFGNILRSKYFNDNPSKSELLVFEELKELAAAQQKDGDEVKQKTEEEKMKKEEKSKKKR